LKFTIRLLDRKCVPGLLNERQNLLLIAIKDALAVTLHSSQRMSINYVLHSLGGNCELDRLWPAAVTWRTV
jgi:hypothetical protein